MSDNQSAVNNQEIQKKYMQIKNEYKQLVKTIVSLEDEKKEHLFFYQFSFGSNKRAGK